MKLIPNWRQCWRFWSIWLQAFAAVFFSFLTVIPDATIQIWSVLPSDIKDAIPPEWVKFVGIAIIVAAIPARLIKQPALARPNADDTMGREGKPNLP